MRLFFTLIANIFFLTLITPIPTLAETVKIGVILPLTGPVAEYGIASRNGIELARKRSPELFSRLQFVYEDSQYDPKLAISAYKKLRTDPGVKVIYNWGSNPSAPLIPVAESEKFPLIVADFSSLAFKNFRYVLAYAPTSDRLGSILSENLRIKGYKKIAILSVENLYINGIIEGLEKSLDSQQKIVFHERVLASDNDLRSHIAKLKRQDCDVIGVLLYAGQVQNFYRTIKSYNIVKPTFGSDFMESRAEIEASGPAIQGAVYPHLSISDEYYRMYRNEYQSDSQVTSSGSAYDLAMILGELNKRDDHFYENYFDKLDSLNSYRGVMGVYTYEHAKDSVKRFYPPVHLKVIKNNFYEVLGPQLLP